MVFSPFLLHWLCLSLSLLCPYRILVYFFVRKQNLPRSVVHLLFASIDLLLLGLIVLVHFWFGFEQRDTVQNAIIANFIASGFEICDRVIWKWLVFGFVSSTALYCSVGIMWELHPMLVIVLLVLPQLLGIYMAIDAFFKEKLAAEDHDRFLQECITKWQQRFENTNKNYLGEIAAVRKINEVMREEQQMDQRKHKDIENGMKTKIKELEIVAKNAVEECEKIKREKEELEENVKQLKLAQNDTKKKHKTETTSQKENLSRAVSHSHDLKAKVAVLRNENNSLQTDWTLLRANLDQVRNELECQKIERNNLLAINQKLKDDLNSKLPEDQINDSKLEPAPSQPKQLINEIFACVKEIFPMINRERVVSELAAMRIEDGGQLRGGKALTVGRIVKSLDDKIQSQSGKSELTALPNRLSDSVPLHAPQSDS